MPRPNLAVFYTGGTISMTHAGHEGSAVPTLTGAQISTHVPGLENDFNLKHIDFGQWPGPHITLERMGQLAQHIALTLEQGVEGVVVTHGTDTLEETVFYLDLVHASDAPVVVVGAMRTSDDLSWDGPVNLYAGCLVASHPQARGMGAMVVMNNTVNAASEVTKTYTHALDTFVSPDVGPLGTIDQNKVFFYRHRPKRTHIPQSATHAYVEVIEATAGNDGRLIQAAVDCGVAGIVVAAMGRGNVPPKMALALIEAMQKGVPVVVCSRCWGGRVAPVYGYEGGGAYLAEAGAVLAPKLNAQKARIALSLALGNGFSHAQISALFS
jgi:L-asparaginase